MYRILQLSIVVQMVLSSALWWPSSGRLFPAVPVVDFLERVPYWVSGLLSSIFVLSVVAMVAGYWSLRRHAIAAVFLILLLGLLDLNRFQVWVWMWCLFWLLDMFGGIVTRGYILVLSGIYFWGGLNKMTPWFADNFDWFCESFGVTSGLAGNGVVAYLVAAFELFLGVLILFQPYKSWTVLGVILFHLYILLVIGPVGYNWNQVVWPWNIAMVGLVWGLRKDSGVHMGRFRPPEVAVILLVWLMPVFNVVGWWPEPFSWKMYSNTQREAGIVSEGGLPCEVLAPYWNRYAVENRYLQIDDWSYMELKVPAFNSLRTFEKVLGYTRACSAKPADQIRLEILTVDRWKR